jgi:hypothetical protein
MATIITKELAIRIAKKLDAEIEARSNKPHDIARIFHNGRLIAHFGIRRGSDKSLGHDHIPREIHVPTSHARLLGQCPMSKQDWIEAMAQQNRL